MTADDLTRPERFAQRVQAKRYRALIRRQGICSACVHREQSFGVYHCKNKPDRQGACETDGRAPQFKFDDTVLVKLASAA